MSEPVTNGMTYPPQPPTAVAQTGIDAHLDLRDLLWERGTSGLRRAGGYVREDLLPDLVGLQGARKFKEMRDSSPVIGACLYAIEMICRNAVWKCDPADDSPAAQHYADLLAGMLFDDTDMPWSLQVSEILSFLAFGWSLFEIILKRRQGLDPPPQRDPVTGKDLPALPSQFTDGYIGLGKLAPRSQDTLLRWEFDHTGGLLGMHQLDPWVGRQAYIPYEKCLLFRPTSYKNSPEGRSVLRTAYSPYYFITHLERTEGIGAERDLTGLPVFGTPPQWWLPSATPEEVAQLDLVRRLGRNIRNDEQACLVYPLIYDQSANLLFKFELASSGGAKAIDTDKIIQRHELRITQSLLCDLLFLGHEDVGSFALASSKSTTQSMSLGGYLTVIKDEVNRRLVPLLWRVNELPPALMPTLTHGDVETVDLTELARFILSFGRIYNMQDLENHVRTLAGFPERPGAATHPLPPAIQPHMGGQSSAGGGAGMESDGLGGGSSHGGGSGTGSEGLGEISPPGSAGGTPDLDRALSSQSLGF